MYTNLTNSYNYMREFTWVGTEKSPKKMMNASQWKTVKVITSLHTLIAFHFESEFQSNCVPG